MSGERPSRVVAELGRPETPDETARRKARDRALRKSRQTTRNLVASLVATLAVVAVIVLAVPRGAGIARPAIDVGAVADQYVDTAGQPLLAPAVPSTWRANAAELRGSGDASSWYIGYVVGGSGFAAVTEGLPGSSQLLDTTLDGARPTGTTEIGGAPWRVYDRRGLGGAAGNTAYALAARFGEVRVAVYGTLTATRMRALALAVVRDAAKRGLDPAVTLP